MSGRSLAGLVRAVAGPPPGSDAELLGRFVDRRCPDAFAALVQRHGPTVLGVCRRTLGDGPDADDAFQAVWLVLVRKAAAVRPRGRVGPFLYGVAVRTAAHVRGRRRRHGGLPDVPDPRPVPDAELAAVIDAELSALPAAQRAAVVLCEIEGRSLKEAAGDLGVPVGTLASRLARGRQRLADRLRRRGVAVSAAGLSGWLAAGAAARVPAGLTDATTLALAGEAAARVTDLSHGVLTMLLFDKLRRAAVTTVGIGVVLAGGLAPDRPTAVAADPTPAEAAVRPANRRPPADRTERFEKLWAGLGDDQSAAMRAALAFAATPAESVAFLKTKLKPVAVDRERLPQWLADADGPDAAKQAEAVRQLDYIASLVRPELEAAAKAAKSDTGRDALNRLFWMAAGHVVVQKRFAPGAVGGPKGEPMHDGWYRVTRVVFDEEPLGPIKPGTYRGTSTAVGPDAFGGPEKPKGWWPATNALAVLEHFGTPDAVAVIKDVATGHPDAAPTKAAQAALDRLAKR